MKPARTAFRAFDLLFLSALFIFPFFFGSVNLWAFCIGTFVLCGAFSVHWFRNDMLAGLLRSETDRWLAAYAAAFLAALAFSKVPYLSWVELFKLSVVVCAFWATRHYCRERQHVYRLAETFLLIAGSLSAVGLLQFVGGLPNDWWSHPQFLSSMYVNHNHFAGLLVLLLPISFGLVLAERDASKKTLFIFLMALSGVAFVFALSRGALVSLGAAMLFMVWMLRKQRFVSSGVIPFTLFVTLVVVAVLMFGTAPIEQRIENIQVMNQEEELSLRYRTLTWAGTLRMIAASPWLGWGPGTFGHAFLPFRPEGFSMRPVHAHNDVLQAQAECGVFALAALAGLFWTFFRAGRRAVRLDDSRLRIGVGSGVMAGIFGMLVHALFDFNFHVPANWLLAAVAAGMLLSMGPEERVYDGKLSSRVSKTLVSSLLPAVLLVCLYLGVSDYRLWEAKHFLKQGDRAQAMEAVEASLKVNPFEPEAHYLRGFIGAQTDVRRAAADIERAIARNRYEPIYDLAKARALAPLLAVDDPKALAALYRRALAKDPNNSWLAWTAARDMLENDSAHRKPLREEAERMLEKAVDADPTFAEKSFDVMWKHDKNVQKILAFHERVPASLDGLLPFLERKDLWRWHRRYHLKKLGIDPAAAARRAQDEQIWKKEPSQSFTLDDFSHAGTEEINQKAFFHSNGELLKKIDIRKPLVRLVLYAKGQPSVGVYPVLYVRIDGKVVDEYYVDSPDFKNYYTDLQLPPGPHLLSIEYVNDVQNVRRTSEDRNVWIQRVSLLEP